MIRVLFICHGNICRSPMAEYIMKQLVSEQGVSDCFEIASAATSTEELGNPVYPPAKAELARHGIDCSGHHARQVCREDYEYYDLLIVMETYNLRNLRYILPEDPKDKVHRLLDYTKRPRDIDDPWYTRQFNVAYAEIEEGCQALLEYCLSQEQK